MRAVAFALWSVLGTLLALRSEAASGGDWTFVISGDSRNCGDVVMPSIALAALTQGSSFYWHLGDFRRITDIDEDVAATHPQLSLPAYHAMAWNDFIENQIKPFGALPVFVGIGNHETKPPKTRTQFVTQFGSWLDTPTLRTQRLQDDPHDSKPHSYYHWRQDGIEFIYLDNASDEQFDSPQLAWIASVIQRTSNAPQPRAVVVGMHEALPDSIANDHSMGTTGESSVGKSSGRLVYQQLLELHKRLPVYLLASHSHYYMAGIYDTPYWRQHGGVLPGWIVGTAGAIRYDLPLELYGNKENRAHAYGYLTGLVKASAGIDPVTFRFTEVTQTDVPQSVTARYGASLVQTCYLRNP